RPPPCGSSFPRPSCCRSQASETCGHSTSKRRQAPATRSEPLARALYGDHDLSFRVSFAHVSESVRRLVEFVLPIDDRPDLSGLEKLLQSDHVFFVQPGDEQSQLLRPTNGCQADADQMSQRAVPTPHR